MLRRFVIGVLTTGSMLALGAQTAMAQSNVEVNAGIQFDFLSPGARSLALGGAFTALADDATTAYTNPAGLREISRKEVSFEARIRSFSTPFTLRGHAFGNPSGNGVDTVAGLVDGTSDETVFAPSFVSFVYPSAKWAIAAYRHDLAHFKTNIATEGAFLTVPGQTQRLLPVQGSLDLKVVDYGVSGSYSLNDKAAVGAGLVVYQFSADSLTTRFLATPTIFSPATYTAANVESTQSQTGDGTSLGLNVGVQFKPSSMIDVGLVYTRRTSFDLQVTNTTTVAGKIIDDAGRFHVPDVFSAGVAFRASPSVRIAADYTFVNYSAMTDDFVDVFALSGSNPADYSVEDGNELHVGAEYLISNSKAPVTLRGGFWFDPSHSLVYSGSIPQFQVLFRERDSEMHYSGGIGVGLNRIELNAGFDISKLVKTTSISAVVRF